MRVGYPVIFIRNGVEHAGIVATSSAKDSKDLVCNVAYWDTEIRGWRQADDVPYLSIERPVPAEGDFYSEVGAPDPQERAADAAAHEARRARLAGAELADESIRSPDPLPGDVVDEALEREARDRAEARMDEEGPKNADLAADPGRVIAAADDSPLETSELEARPIG